MTDKVKSIINPDAILDEEAQKRVYTVVSNKLGILEDFVAALKLMKAKANRKQLTANDMMRLQDLFEEIK